MDWDGTYIVDDELKTLFSGLAKGVNLEVLLDCCHSGTGTREAAAMASFPPDQAVKARFLAPPIDILCRQMDEDDLPMTRMLRTSNPADHVLSSVNCRPSAAICLPSSVVCLFL